jgi:Mg-chelatase subunit ChlD
MSQSPPDLVERPASDPRTEAALLRWRLIVGPDAEGGASSTFAAADGVVGDDARLARVDRALDFLYGRQEERSGGLGASAPYVPTWLGDIRRYFPRDVVAFMEKEAIDRRGLRQLLLEPETLAILEKDVALAATILGFKSLMPEETRRTARQVVAEIVEELRQRLELQLRQAVLGALQRNRHAPLKVARNLDVRRTVREGMRHYEPSLGKIVPERIYFYANQRRFHEWRIIVLVDQSGSMGESVVYSAVFAAVFAALPALDTRLVLFDTNVADVSDQLSDPVELLFGVQLGGGTDIARAVAYGSGLVEQPERTLMIIITDLHEGGDRGALLRGMAALRANRVRVLCVLALNDGGVASFDHTLAREVAALEIPTFAATPNRLVAAVERALKGESVDAGTI